jgi:hypothetical protein
MAGAGIGSNPICMGVSNDTPPPGYAAGQLPVLHPVYAHRLEGRLPLPSAESKPVAGSLLWST